MRERFGHYELLDVLWTHARVTAYRARIPPTDSLARLDVAPEDLTDFIDAARLAVGFSHQNIAALVDVGKVADNYYIAFEHLDGERLVDVAARTTITPEAGRYIVGEILLALAYIHDHRNPFDDRALEIVHRDVNASNVFITLDAAVKLMGFRNAASVLRTSALAAIPDGAPELQSAAPGDARSDVFGAAKLFAGMVDAAESSRMASVGNGGSAAVPAGFARKTPLDDVIRRALHPDPAQRFPTARAFVAELDRVAPRSADGRKSLAQIMQTCAPSVVRAFDTAGHARGMR